MPNGNVAQLVKRVDLLCSADDVSEGFKLIIYSRDDCSLCEGLKVILHGST